MSLTGHLKELRNRIFICLVLLVAAMIAGLNLAPRMVRLLLDIGGKYDYQFVYIAPQELLLQYFSISLIIAVCVTLPMLLYQLWAFISPGLRKNENMFFLLAMVFGLICFCIGVYFAYRVMLPFMLHFLISLSEGSGVEASISVQNYLSFLMTIFIIFGAVFELPVLSLLLTQMGLLKVSWMKKFRKIVIVAIFFVSAIITPPDIVSQVMVAIPILFLYELSIILCTIFQKLKKEKEE
jgi:sec-independent protein translocase protein TatC